MVMHPPQGDLQSKHHNIIKHSNTIQHNVMVLTNYNTFNTATKYNKQQYYKPPTKITALLKLSEIAPS